MNKNKIISLFRSISLLFSEQHIRQRIKADLIFFSVSFSSTSSKSGLKAHQYQSRFWLILSVDINSYNLAWEISRRFLDVRTYSYLRLLLTIFELMFFQIYLYSLLSLV